MIINMKAVPAVIMCGGLGKRLESVTKNEIPKCMVDVNGKPFLCRLIDKIRSYGVRHFILCVGFRHKIIIDSCNKQFKDSDIEINYSYDSVTVEDKLIGTTQALIKVGKILSPRYKAFFVLNGDSYFGFDLDEWITTCINGGYLHKMYGCSFSVYTEGLNSVDSGVYLLSPFIFNVLNHKSPYKLQDSLKQLALRNMFCNYWGSNKNENLLIDIGTLEGYKKALECFK